MMLFLLFVLIVPYYNCNEFNSKLEKYFENLIVTIFYQNIIYQDNEVLLKSENIENTIIYYLRNNLSNFHSVNGMKIGFYFEGLKMQCSLYYFNYSFPFQITKEVSYE